MFLLVVLAVAAEAVRLTRVPPAAYHPTFAEIPREIGAYTGVDLPPDESVLNFLSATAMLERRYDGPDGSVSLSVLYAPDWRSIHSPEGCYPAQGWTVLSEQTITLPSSAGPLRAKLIRLKKNDLFLLALFSFAYYGGTTADWTAEGLRVALGPRGAGGVVFTLSTPVAESAPETAYHRLTKIMQVAYPAAISFWKKN
ncbi:MAG: EpsI family protein [candidate division WS1 bacterium]|nr:EpsI family protein [candidate division WS1 bacterium]